MSDEIDFWRVHLGSVEMPLIHFVPPNFLDSKVVKEVTRQVDFALFQIDCEHVSSESALMDELAKTMNFPNYFGRNWNAVLDLSTDLSWEKASGYVLVLFNADSLLSFVKTDFSGILDVAEATVRYWRDERGEYGEREGPVSFHIIFSGSDTLRKAILQDLSEPLCDHQSEAAVIIIRAPGGIDKSESFQDAKNLLRSGAEPELVLSLLRERGVGKIDSVYMIAGLLDKTIPEAKLYVDNSQTWSIDRNETDTKTRNAAREALRDLGFDDI